MPSSARSPSRPLSAIRFLIIVASACALIHGSAGALTAATAEYPLDAFYVPIAQSSTLQTALNQYHQVRLDPGNYNTGTMTAITMQSGYRIYGLTTKIPSVTITPGATGVVLSDVVVPSLTFPPSSLVTSNNLFFRLAFVTILASGATLDSNLFLDLYESSLTINNTAGGKFTNNRFIRMVAQGGPQMINVVGDAGRSSSGNTFLFVNALTPQPVSQGYIYFSNLADLAVLGMDYEDYSTSGLPGIQLGSMGAYRQLGFNGYLATGIPFDVSADEFQLTSWTYSGPGGGVSDVVYRPSNLRSLVQPTGGSNNVTDQATSPFRLTAFVGSGTNAVFDGAPVTTLLASASQTTLGNMVAPTRTEVPWERPTFITPPDPGGPTWNTGLSSQTDSRAMIQGLINTAKANSTYAFLPAGTYYISGPLNLGTTNGLVGAGMDNTLIIAMSPTIDMVVGDGTAGLNLHDLTLEGGANGIHHTPTTCGTFAQFTDMHLSHVTFRNFTNAALFFDQIYGWDNNLLDSLNIVSCTNGVLQNPSTTTNPDQICYMDKTMFYGCQFISCGRALNLPAGRANNVNVLVNCLIQGSTVAAATLNNNTAPLFANCTFINNAGNPAFLNNNDLEFVSCDFQAGPSGHAMVLAPNMVFEGCSFEQAGGTGATILGSNSSQRIQYFSNCQSADMAVGGLSTTGVVLNSAFTLSPANSGFGMTFNAGVPVLFANQTTAPAPQLLVGSTFPSAFLETIAGVVAPAIFIGAPATPGNKLAVRTGDTVTYAISYTNADAISLSNANVIVNATGNATATATVSGSGLVNRTVTLSGISGTGTLSISLVAGTASDSQSNLSLAAGPSASIPVIDTPPSAAASSSPAITSLPQIPFTISFSSAVSGLTSTGLTVTNGSVIALSGSGSSYTASVLPIAVGLVTVTVPAGAAVDAAGNGNLASTPVSVTYTVAGPSVTVNQAATQANPTTTPTIAFTASFSTPVTGFTASNVALSGTASGPLTVAVTAADTLGASYTLTVTGLTSSGTVSASVPANQVFVSGAPNFASTNTNDLVVYNAPSTAGSASTNAASSGGGGGGGGCGSGLNAAILPMLMLFLWRRKRS